MKTLLLLTAGLLGFGALGLTSAKADSSYYDDRDGGYEYRRPVYHDRDRDRDDCDYRSQRRVVVREYYERPFYRGDDCRPRYRHRRHHVNFFLPLPHPPF